MGGQRTIYEVGVRDEMLHDNDPRKAITRIRLCQYVSILTQWVLEKKAKATAVEAFLVIRSSW